MNKYNLDQVTYYITYNNNSPLLNEFIIAVIRETDAGFEYANIDVPTAPYIPENQLFATIQDAVDNGKALLDALVPTA